MRQFEKSGRVRSLALGVRWGAILAACAGLTVGLGMPTVALGQGAEAGTTTQAGDDRGSHRVSNVVIRYVRAHPELPTGESLLDTVLRVIETPQGFASPEEDPSAPVRELKLSELSSLSDPRFTDTGITLFDRAIFRALRERGFLGVYVEPSAAEFRVEDGRLVDLREPGSSTITLEVTVGTVTLLRTIALGERIDPEADPINHPLHRRIRERSPIAPEGERPGTTSLLRESLVRDYVALLNRREGRRVDSVVGAPGDQPGAVSLDYIVTENRPWLLFGQLANNGTDATGNWRQHFGFIHNDLTNHDDTLTVGYHTANFEDTHAVYGFYERPLGSTPRVRWRVHGQWYIYDASDVGQPDANFTGEGYDAGARIYWNFYQRHELFIDAYAGARFEFVHVENELADVSGKDGFFLPVAGVRLERVTETARTDANAFMEWNVASLGGTNEDLDALGRTDAEPDFAVLRIEAQQTAFLEPLLAAAGTRPTTLAHEVRAAVNAQWAFDNRLVPNQMQTQGGLYTVRGYPQSVVAGDSGIYGTLEYRYHVARGLTPRSEPGSMMGRPFRFRPQYAFGPTDWNLLLKAFVDAGRTENSDRREFEADQTLVGAGIGAELAWTRRFNLRADLGFALRELEDADGASVVDAGHAELYIVLTLIY